MPYHWKGIVSGKGATDFDIVNVDKGAWRIADDGDFAFNAAGEADAGQSGEGE